MWRRNSPAGFNGGVARSDDGGRSWRVQNNGMPQTAATHILRDPSKHQLNEYRTYVLLRLPAQRHASGEVRS